MIDPIVTKMSSDLKVWSVPAERALSELELSYKRQSWTLLEGCGRQQSRYTIGITVLLAPPKRTFSMDMLPLMTSVFGELEAFFEDFDESDPPSDLWKLLVNRDWSAASVMEKEIQIDGFIDDEETAFDVILGHWGLAEHFMRERIEEVVGRVEPLQRYWEARDTGHLRSFSWYPEGKRAIGGAMDLSYVTDAVLGVWRNAHPEDPFEVWPAEPEEEV